MDEGARAERRLSLLRGARPHPWAEPSHDLRGSPLSEHLGVLGARDGHLPDPRRHVHARVPLLLRQLGKAGASAGSARAAASRPDRRADGAQARRRHLRGPGRRSRPGAGHYAATIRALQEQGAGGVRRGAHTRFSRSRGGGAAHGARRPARGLQPQHRDRATAPPAHARRQGLLRQGALAARPARRSSPTTPC